MAVCMCDKLSGGQHLKQRCPSEDVTHFRWDHAPLNLYYEQTRLLMQPVLAELDSLNDKNLSNQSIIESVDRCYESVIDALQRSANLFIPKHKKNFYKFWWSQELDELKDKAIASCRMWKDAGKPRSGPIHAKYIQDKLRYKKRIREERGQETSIFTNDLHDALMNKSGCEFWKNWNSKFENKVNNILQVDGITDSRTIADKFAKHFEQICTPFSAVRNEGLKAKYLLKRSTYCGSPVTDSEKFDVQLLSELINKMKNGKAAGLDGISCEHIKFSHPIVVVILCRLFNLFVEYSHIPTSFGSSYTVPIPKCDSRSRSLTVDDFRGISISPVISKLFEMAILDRFNYYFVTTDHQFGFKKHLSCRHVIYSVRRVIESYIDKGSTVNVCALDMSKAYDRTNHFSLYMRLMDRKLPIELLNIFEAWFCLSETCVKWVDKLRVSLL